MARIVYFFLLFALTVPVLSFGTQNIGLDDASPTVALLRSVKDDKIGTEDVKNVIRGCFALHEGGQITCMQRTIVVLETLSEKSADQRRIIHDVLKEGKEYAFSVMQMHIIEDSQREFQRFLAEGVGESPSAHRTLAQHFKKLAEGSGPPKKEDINKTKNYDARLFTYVDGLLGSDPNERIRGAFKAAITSDCAGILGGQGEGTCRELGLWQIQRACLSVVFQQIYEYRGDEATITRFMSVDQSLQSKVIDTAKGCDDVFLKESGLVLDRWMQKKPTRWLAWADVIQIMQPEMR